VPVVDETTLRKIQAVAAIGGGVVALHGVTSDAWQRRHTLFVGLSVAASVGLFVLPLLRKSASSAAPPQPS
jgi:EamA domain-containing membrane protein RarD